MTNQRARIDSTKLSLKAFKHLVINCVFMYNGVTYTKQSSRTALMHGINKWFYFGMSDSCLIL